MLQTRRMQLLLLLVFLLLLVQKGAAYFFRTFVGSFGRNSHRSGATNPHRTVFHERSAFLEVAKVLGNSANRSSEQKEHRNDQHRSGFVAVLGNPNVGKSTLVNCLMQQQLCAVSSKPQTTRHSISCVLTGGSCSSGLGRGQQQPYQLVLCDTPGFIERPMYSLQQSMRDIARGAMRGADMVLLVVDLSAPTVPLVDGVVSTSVGDTRASPRAKNGFKEGEHHELIAKLRNISETARIPIIIALNKVDKFVRGGALKGDSLDRIRRESESGTKSTDIRESSSIVVDSAFDDGGGEMNDDDDDNDYEDEDDDDDAAAGRRTYSYERLNVNTPGARRVYPATVAAAVAHWRELIPGAVAIVPISAQHGTNVQTELLDQLVRHAPPGPPFFPDDAITDRPERFFVSEIIRECIMEEYRAEIPYSCEVLVTAFKRPLVGSEVVGSEGDSREKERRRDSSAVTKSNQDGSATAISTAGTAPPLGPVTSAHIEAAIYVTRKSQKGILIGKKGAKISELVQSARRKIAEVVDCDVKCKIVNANVVYNYKANPCTSS